MSVFDLTTAIVLAALGIATAYFLLKPIIPAIWKLVRGGSHNLRFKKSAERLKRIDDFLERERWQEALAELKGSFITEQFSTREAIRAARDHNQNVLSRCLLLAEGVGSRAENIGEVERLLMENTELQLLHLKSGESFHKLRFKRAQESKELPAWTKTDFDRRNKELLQELKRNRSETERAASALFAALDSPREPEVTYH